MKIEDLQARAEDIQEVEEITSEESSAQSELTPEQKEIQEKFLRGMVVKRFKTVLKLIYERMKLTHKTIDELKQEVQNKQSPFSFSQRQFILGFKTDFIEQLLTDLYNKKELHEINFTSSKTN